MEMNKPGLLIGSLLPGSPAFKAGVKLNDRLLAVDGRAINNFNDYIEATEEWVPTHTLDIIRGNELLTIKIDLGEEPEHLSQEKKVSPLN
jgi:S1-C subfamily serine protease